MSTSPPQGVSGRRQRSQQDWLAGAEPEPVLEADLPIVDAHLHFWHTPGHRYFVEEFAHDLAGCGHDVRATVFVECNAMYRARGPEHTKCVGETEFAVGMAAMGASQQYTVCDAGAAIVAFADLTLGERTRETLEAHLDAANGRLRGVRQRAKWDCDPAVTAYASAGRPSLLLDPAFGRGLDMLAGMGMAFEASIYHPQIPEVTALAQAHPEASIVLTHSGSPVGFGAYAGKDAENQADWLTSMTELARCPNVFVKLGGLLMTLRNFDFEAAEKPPTSQRLAELWRPYIEPCIELFGADRCMVASNFPVDKAGIPYGTVWNMFKRITVACSADEKALIFSGTARRVYRLPAEAEAPLSRPPDRSVLSSLVLP